MIKERLIIIQAKTLKHLNETDHLRGKIDVETLYAANRDAVLALIYILTSEFFMW